MASDVYEFSLWFQSKYVSLIATKWSEYQKAASNYEAQPVRIGKEGQFNFFSLKVSHPICTDNLTYLLLNLFFSPLNVQSLFLVS